MASTMAAGSYANRPLGVEPKLFVMFFLNLIPIPNTMPKVKNLLPSAELL